MIGFCCEHCGYRINVSQIQAGKKAVCPKCRSFIVVPSAESTDTTASQGNYARSDDSAYDLTLLDVQERDRVRDVQTGRSGSLAQADEHEPEPGEESHAQEDYVDKRRLPWFIDVFLYPFSKAGSVHLAIFIGAPLLTAVLQNIAPVPLLVLCHLADWVVKCLVFLYLCWYAAACVRDSADGWVRAPEGLGALPDLSDMFEQAVNIFGSLAVFFGPVVIYRLIAGGADVIFWQLLGLTIFFYPMVLLAVVIFDSAEGVRIGLLLGSIRRTFPPYFRLVLLLFIPAAIFSIIPSSIRTSLFLTFIVRSVLCYITLVEAHLLGRFYWRHKTRLNWSL